MLALAEQEEMKKKREQKKEFFRYAMNLANGIQSCKDQNSGILTTEKYIKEKMYGCSLSAIGLNWMCGTISVAKKLPYHQFISRMSDKYCITMGNSWPYRSSSSWNQKIGLK